MLSETRGVRVVDNQATLLPLAVPFSFAVTKSDEGILLSGNVPYGDARAKISPRRKTPCPASKFSMKWLWRAAHRQGFFDLVDFALARRRN